MLMAQQEHTSRPGYGVLRRRASSQRLKACWEGCAACQCGGSGTVDPAQPALPAGPAGWAAGRQAHLLVANAPPLEQDQRPQRHGGEQGGGEDKEHGQAGQRGGAALLRACAFGMACAAGWPMGARCQQAALLERQCTAAGSAPSCPSWLQPQALSLHPTHTVLAPTHQDKEIKKKVGPGAVVAQVHAGATTVQAPAPRPHQPHAKEVGQEAAAAPAQRRSEGACVCQSGRARRRRAICSRVRHPSPAPAHTP